MSARTIVLHLLPVGRDSRALAGSVLVATIGTGAFATGGVIFFVKSVGLEVGQVAFGLSVAGALGMAAGVIIGQVSDRIGPRQISIVTLAIRSIATAMLLWIPGFLAFLVTVTVMVCAERGSGAATGALIARVGGTERIRFRAYLRSVTNIGVSLGAVLAGLAIAQYTQGAFKLMVLGVSVALAGAAAILLLMKPTPKVPVQANTPRWSALRDRRYLLVTGMHGILSLHFEVLTFAIPLWIVQIGTIPLWLVAAFMIINTTIVILLQVPASRGVTSIPTAATTGRRAGIMLLLGCTAVGLSGVIGQDAALVALFAGVLLLTIGELWQSASSFGLSFDLAAEHAQGQYQGVFALGRGGAKAIAPALLAVLCLQWGAAGWLALGSILFVTGALLPLAVKLGTRSRLEVAPHK